MPVKRYRKLPLICDLTIRPIQYLELEHGGIMCEALFFVDIEAVQWLGTNQDEVFDFLAPMTTDSNFWDKPTTSKRRWLIISNLDGDRFSINLTDWIIRDALGKFSTCTAACFSEAYIELDTNLSTLSEKRET